MTTTTTDRTDTTPDPVELPGRAVDIIHAAARATGGRLTNLDLSFHGPDDGLNRIVGHLERQDVVSAQRLIAALGADAEVSAPYGPPARPQANVEARIPALGGLRINLIATEGLQPDPDPADLIAEVAARRRHATAGTR